MPAARTLLTIRCVLCVSWFSVPIPCVDNLGKEVFTRFTSDIASANLRYLSFFTAPTSVCVFRSAWKAGWRVPPVPPPLQLHGLQRP